MTVLQDQLHGIIELEEGDPMLESQIFKQARKKSEDWLRKLILIFSIFLFLSYKLLPVR